MNSIIQMILKKPVLLGSIIGGLVLLLAMLIFIGIKLENNRKIKLKVVEKLPYPFLGTVREITINESKKKRKKRKSR